ncbi:MAG: hypothetical protein HGB36_11735 [Chlorobiaceae bacterium]|nr:hypothetical protein [Chlorobiaceae bacterium]
MKWIKSILFSVLFLLPAAAFADLTGAWSCNDGGKYYIHQIGKEVFWYGENSATSPAWSNVATGTIDGNFIILRWADVPKGSIMSGGILELTLVSPNKFQATVKTGGFGGSVWSRP